MRIGPYEFKPSVIPSVATVVFLILLISLGNWQWGRADKKFKDRELRSKSDRTQVIDLDPKVTNLNAVLAQHIKTKGQFDGKHEVYLANTKYKGRPGFFVIQTFKLSNSDYSVLVVRGWTPMLGDFRSVPKVPKATAGVQQLNGIIDRIPVAGIKKGRPDLGFDSWPKIVTYIDLKWFESSAGQKLLPYVVKQKGASVKGLVRDWRFFKAASAAIPPEKHMSYAFQWYSLAACLVVIYLVVNTRRAKDAPRSEEVS